MSSHSIRRKVRGLIRMPSAAVLRMDQNALTARVADVLRLVFTEQRSGVKRLAQTAGASPRTAENWLRGDNMPDGFYMLRLMATVPEFASEVRRLTGAAADLAPTFERDLHRLIQTYHRVSEARTHASDVLATDGAVRSPTTEPPHRQGGLARREGVGVDAPPRAVDDAA